MKFTSIIFIFILLIVSVFAFIYFKKNDDQGEQDYSDYISSNPSGNIPGYLNSLGYEVNENSGGNSNRYAQNELKPTYFNYSGVYNEIEEASHKRGIKRPDPYYVKLEDDFNRYLEQSGDKCKFSLIMSAAYLYYIKRRPEWVVKNIPQAIKFYNYWKKYNKYPSWIKRLKWHAAETAVWAAKEVTLDLNKDPLPPKKYIKDLLKNAKCDYAKSPRRTI